MSTVLSVYTKDAFKEYLLPSLNNADYVITLYSGYFHLQADVQLKLEVLDHTWRIQPDTHYQVKKDDGSHKGEYRGQPLKNNDILRVQTNYMEDMSIIVRDMASSFHVYTKFQLEGVGEITIGKRQENDIVYHQLGMVSGTHAKMEKTHRGYRILNSSPNGIYVNSMRVDKSMELTFGDYINIIGLHMVFLGDLLAIDTQTGQVQIGTEKLKEYVPDEGRQASLHSDAPMSTGKTLYHRAPRNYVKLDADKIEIENPPQLNQTRKQPLFLTVGPAITMALPMLLGCMMMIYASGSSGAQSSLYLYSGLIMSVSSAAIGVGWTLMNMRYQKKEEKEREEYRFQAYSQYLIEKADEIKEKYEHTAAALTEMYPDAKGCLRYDERKGILWSRNRSHEDFLQHRLGIGDKPFQIQIDVPKKHFQLYKDELEEKPAFIKENYGMLYQVPITVDLVKHNLIGVVGGKRKKGAIEVARILSAQLAANNCYTDIKLGYVYNENTTPDFEKWNYAKWLPHVWSEDKKIRFVASNREEASDIFYELTKVFRTRMEEGDQNRKKELPKPYYIVFISDLSMLEGELFSKYVFERFEGCGLTTVLLAESYEELPNTCDFIIENTENFQGMYQVFAGEEARQALTLDHVEEEELEAFARHLSTLQVLEIEEGGEIPTSLTFFEMFHIHKLEELPVKELWAKNRTYENIRGIIGEKAGGAPCYLDVHEKYHGPHGLVAGTTGSGKSETLQTYMLSLAVNYSPDDIGFFIIDYKGGGMANLFKGLPHMIGQISNLSGNQVKRAMISIKSENRRRQRVFTEHGVNNINAYTKLYKNGEAAQPVPHLFIIVDEFAELKKEEPDFMQELISVAQVGRSLGVHMILATQKPNGTVDDNIWSNSKFRLCLRVQDKQDSNDMLHKPDAAYITQAGRCYLQVGNDEVYELFQSGFSGAVYDEHAAVGNTEIARIIGLTGRVEMTGNTGKISRKKRAETAWMDTLIGCVEEGMRRTGIALEECEDSANAMQQLSEAMYQALENRQIDYAQSKYNTARLQDFLNLYAEIYGKEGELPQSEKLSDLAAERGMKLPQAKERTQLDAVKDYLASIAKVNGFTHKLQLWMPVLGDKIYLDEFEGYRESCFESLGGWKSMEGEWSLSMVLGRMDDPANQSQMPLTVNFAEEGHIGICGSIVCGKSTMMQTMAYALIQTYSPDAVNLYALDFSGKMMSAFEEAPHFGGVMYESDLDKIGKFFNMLQAIMEERKQLFRGGNYKQYVQVNGLRLPAIVVFIDNYAAFKEKTGEAYEEALILLSKEGISQGIFLVVSGSGFGMNEITTRVAENLNTILCLALSDKYAYGDLLHNMQIEVLPESGVKGRGLAYYGKQILEYQTALALRAENDYQRMERIRQMCVCMKETWKGKGARRVPEIPKKPVWSQFCQLDEFEKLAASPEYLPVGYDGANAQVYGIPLRRTYCYLIYGAGRTGKTNFLKVCLQAAMEKESVICVIEEPGGALRSYEASERITYASEEQSIFAFFKTLLPIFKERNQMKNKMLNEDYEEDEIFSVMCREIPYFIFISDLSWFVSLIYHAELDMRGFLENIIAKGSLHHIYFISDLALEQRSMIAGYQIYELFARYGTGIHFGGKTADNPNLNFEYLSFMEQSKTEKPGVGLLPAAGNEKDTQRVVVPLARR